MALHDPRVTPARPDLAALRLKGQVAAERYVAGELLRVSVPAATLWSGPEARRAGSQLLFGETFELFERSGGLAWGQAPRDSYVGYVEEAALGPLREERTHRVAVPLSHIYPAPDAKEPPVLQLPFGAELSVRGEADRFLAVARGFVPVAHLRELGRFEPEPVAVAERFRGAPYLWGGRTMLGIDCSGLVQLALAAAGIPCPRDTDMQAAEVGQPLAEGARLRRGDLVFWQGHVGLMQDEERLIHANAFHMGVASEPLAQAAARIARTGGGPVTARRRL
ncbi:MAG TPA: NlpC/P60 family protein [Paracoccaceae bacterium]|nr:NlpC/P60 family protein [Paracoccaceae bacterium]